MIKKCMSFIAINALLLIVSIPLYANVNTSIVKLSFTSNEVATTISALEEGQPNILVAWSHQNRKHDGREYRKYKDDRNADMREDDRNADMREDDRNADMREDDRNADMREDEFGNITENF